jgi:hypothetical protein
MEINKNGKSNPKVENKLSSGLKKIDTNSMDYKLEQFEKAGQVLPNANLKDGLIYLGLGFQLFVTTIVFILIGKYLDEKLELNNFLMLIFGVIGFILGMTTFFKIARKKDPDYYE